MILPESIFLGKKNMGAGEKEIPGEDDTAENVIQSKNPAAGLRPTAGISRAHADTKQNGPFLKQRRKLRPAIKRSGLQNSRAA